MSSFNSEINRDESDAAQGRRRACLLCGQRRDSRADHLIGPTIFPTARRRATSRLISVLLGLACGAWFWLAASRNDWLAGVAAGVFLAGFILDLGRWARGR